MKDQIRKEKSLRKSIAKLRVLKDSQLLTIYGGVRIAIFNEGIVPNAKATD